MYLVGVINYEFHFSVEIHVKKGQMKAQSDQHTPHSLIVTSLQVNFQSEAKYAQTQITLLTKKLILQQNSMNLVKENTKITIQINC